VLGFGHHHVRDLHNEAVVRTTQSKAPSIHSEWKTALRIHGLNESKKKNIERSGYQVSMEEVPLFGTNKENLKHFLENRSNRDWTTSKVTPEGWESLSRLMIVCQRGFGITYCPLLPYLSALLLTHMSEPYAYLCLREMITDAHAYMPTNIVEYHQWNNTFAQIVKRMFPETYQEMVSVGILTAETPSQDDRTICGFTGGLAPIFQRFFVDLIPLKFVLRIIDIYAICGMETIFRFGIALFSLVKTRVKGVPASAELWWDNIRDYTFSPAFKFEALLARAYKNIGGRFHKSIRFPRSHVLARLIKSNEKWAMENASSVESKSKSNATIKQLTVVDLPVSAQDGHCFLLAQRDEVRTSPLLSWLPPTLRDTKLDLIYSTSIHGRSIRSLYDRCSKTKRTIMLVEAVTTGAVIGVYATQAWHIDSRVYGDGNCFVFRLSPDPVCYKWTPPTQQRVDNAPAGFDQDLESQALWERFMVGKHNFISIGANKTAGSALRLNEDLTRGESSTAFGYQNEPLAGGNTTDFEVGTVEVYRFIRNIDGLPIL
jgi:hypothetical protein